MKKKEKEMTYMYKLVGRLEYDGKIIETRELFGPGTYDEIIEERHKVREVQHNNKYPMVKGIAKEKGLDFEKLRMWLAIEEVDEK